MDAVRVLGAMLGNRAGRTPRNGQILGEVLNGVAAITRAAQPPSRPHPADRGRTRFPPSHHAPFEAMVRDSVARRHRQGGRFPSPAEQWINGGGRIIPAPPPHHDRHHHDHHTGLAYDARAQLLITAMIMASQADGQIDPREQEEIISQLQPLDATEAAFLRREFQRPHDLHAFARSVPNGMEYEVYSVSLMAIDVDTRAEVAYLRQLAECLRISGPECQSIHRRYGHGDLF
ncbi:MAG: DUF533 domain-containing protein [Rhodopirellula sp. JB044]|uniref:DUF533 domain-containing protein n=1 Tax=Rhodopirellula sp. JB044 TaxID=3342844 RepID=UPI00370A04CB